MFTVVIAGEPSPRRTDLEESLAALEGARVVAVTEGGGSLLLLLQRYRPDLLLLELKYSTAQEALTLFQQRPALRPPYVVTYSGEADPQRTLEECGMTEETEQALNEMLPPPRLHLVCPPCQNEEVQLERRIGELLFSLGMPANQKGYRYLVWALKRVEENPEELTLLTKSLYVEIAHHFHSSQGAVERAMRNAIGNAYRQGNRATWMRYFPRRDQSKAPSNGELLAGLHEVLRLELVENAR